MKIIPLSEGAFTIDQTKVFVPFDKGVDDLTLRPSGSLLVEIQPFLVITSSDIILLDTGLGYEVNGVLQIHKNLHANGIGYTDVTKVLLSHLHKDHAGGISYKPNGGPEVLTFPNATYYVHSKELAFANEKGFPSYVAEDFNYLKNSSRLQLLEGNSGAISEEIRFEVSGGHCPYHTVFTIKDQGETAFFGGDVAPQLQQMKSRFSAKYDFDGKKSMELRTKWWEESSHDHRTFLFYHDIKTPVVKR